jgi:penicillin amidase
MYAIWEDDFSAEKNNMLYPTTDVTYHLLMNKPEAKWFDNKQTKDKIETRDDIVKMTFKGTLDSLTKEFGTIDSQKWAWKNVKKTEIAHLVPAFTSFGRYNIPNGGGKWIVNATTTKTGPSWRMVVAVDKGWPKGFGLYPGGQSGNPASKYYDNMIDKWANGELQELLFLKSKEDASPRIIGKLSLQN